MKRLLRGLALSFIGAGAGLLLYCGSFYWKSYLENRQVQEQYAKIREACVEENEQYREKNAEANEKKSQEVKKKKSRKKKKVKESFGISWEKLRSINSEIKGWIEVPGAGISYPIVQGEDDNFYLTHSIDGKKDPFGSIFLGSGNRGDFRDSHSLVYGHNMEGGMMFANLNRYENPDFLTECPGFVITTPVRQFQYEIFSVEQAWEGGAAFQYGHKLGSEEYGEQQEWMKENSMYETGVFPNGQQRIVSLVTCNSRLDPDVRMVIHGICRQILTETDG